ncbi:ABC transporter [Candidatus Woesearchaeota archaeon CG10_big_fil_rev_8_21_14_0_10_37_12]|nr:MAG: ABC transporter [Candidatus Woesearchaeota archaeon CG10_big_fil_rev_8_21_14_0_10_37_12]
MVTENIIIHVKNLRKEFETVKRGHGFLAAVNSLFNPKKVKKKALKGISFDIKEGEIVGLLGPNGAGKSTCLKALSGLLWPDSGTVNILGYVPWKERVKYVKNIGVVFGQKTTLFWDLPAIDTYHLNKDLYEMDNKEYEQQVHMLIKKLNAKDIVKSPVRDLSLGERMRCEVIQSLLHKPKLVFLDEPTIGLDIISKEKLREFILDVNKKEKTTFIVTTHDMQDIEKLCKRVIIINHGTIVYDGLLEKIKKKFAKDKHLEVKLSEKAKPFKFKGCKVLNATDYELKLELDTRKAKVKDLIGYLMEHFDVADIIVSDPPIEEIIAEIFQKKGTTL